MTPGKRVVYITGITGIIGRFLVEGLRNEHRLRGNSRRGTPMEGAEVAKGDVADREFMREQLQGADTVIHLGANSHPSAPWESVLHSNIEGTYEVFEAARLAGARRVIFASSNHVTGILTQLAQDMDVTVPVRPDGFYGVSKAFGETLGRFYADRYGISVLNYRIGWILAETDEARLVEVFKRFRHAGPLMWLSVRDCVEAFRCGIEADPSLTYGIYYIVSNNRDMLWDISNARAEIGYHPKDDLGALFDRCGAPYDFRVPRQGLSH